VKTVVAQSEKTKKGRKKEKKTDEQCTKNQKHSKKDGEPKGKTTRKKNQNQKM
jgi:hypothetical protein